MCTSTCQPTGGPCMTASDCCRGICTAGSCSSGCPAGQVMCGATCTDVTSDPNNCGKCGNVCAAADTCVNGACTSSCTPQGCGPMGIQCGPATDCGNPVNCGPCPL